MHHFKLYIILTSDIYNLLYVILYHFTLSSYRKFKPPWSNLTYLITLYSCNRNVTLEMDGLPAETCRWKYHNKNTSVKFDAFFWFL